MIIIKRTSFSYKATLRFLVAILLNLLWLNVQSQNNFIIAPTLGTHLEFIVGYCEVEGGYISLINSFDVSTTPRTFGLDIIKFNKAGDLISVRNIFSDTSKYYTPRVSSLKKLPNNNLLVFGAYENVGTNRFTSFLIEINENGDILRMKESSPDFVSQSQFNYDAIIDSTSIKILCLDTIMQNTNVRIDLYDLELNKLNETSFELSNGQADSYFIPLKSGGYAIAGFHVRALRIDNYLMLLDSGLEKKWHRFFISNGSGIIMEQPGIAELSNGDIVLSTGLVKGANRILKYLVRVNPETNKIVWEKTFNNGFSHSSFSAQIVVKGSDDIYVPGYSEIPEPENSSRPFFRYPTLTKLDSSGNIQWERLYYVEKYRRGMITYMKSTSDNGFLIAGTAWAFMDYKHGSLFIKSDSLGCIVPGCDSLGMVSSTIEINNPQGTFSYGPNPVLQYLSINYSLHHQSSEYSLQLIDSQGKLIRKLPLAAYTSEGQVIWGMTELPAGTYFLSLFYRDRVQTTAKILKL